MKVRGKKPILGVKSARWTVLCWTILVGITLLLGLFYFSHYSKTKSANSPEKTDNSTVSVTAKARAKELFSQAKDAKLASELHDFRHIVDKNDVLENDNKLKNSDNSNKSVNKAGKQREHRMSTDWGREEIPALRDFSRWADEYAKTPTTSRARIQVKGIKLAQARRKVMLQLIAKDPAKAIASAIPATLESELPENILEHAERRISGIGDLDVVGFTPSPDAPKGIPLIQRFARFDNETYKASVYGQLANARSREQIPMHGVVIDDQAALLDSPIRVLELNEPLDPDKEIVTKNNHPISRMLANRALPANSPPAFAEIGNRIYCLHCAEIQGWGSLMDLIGTRDAYVGSDPIGPIGDIYENLGTDKKLLVVQVDFSDWPGSDVTRTEIINRLADVNDYYIANSHEKFAFEQRDTTEVLRMPQTGEYYLTGNRDSELWDHAMAAAKLVGYDADNYQFAGVSWKLRDDLPYSGFAYLGTKKFFLNGWWGLRITTIAHELGHNLGLMHAAAWDPDSSTQPDDASGTHKEYGNEFDVMGSRNDYYNLNAMQFTVHYKNLLTWIPSSHINTATGNFSGRIYASDRNQITGRNYAVRIDSNRALGGKNNLDYWVEYRSLITEGSNNSYSQNGAMIYLSDPEGSGSQGSSTCRLLDMKPNTSTFTDAPLQNGSSFTDANNRWKIEVTGKGGSGANIYLDIKVTDLNLPVITTHPAHTRVAANASHTLQVVATGGSLSYQWRKNRVDIPGATSSSYTISSFGLSNEGIYDVRVTNSTGSILSETAILGLGIGQVSANGAQDNFGGTTRDSTKWGPVDFIEKAGRFSQNGKKYYFTDSNPTSQDWAASGWHPQALPYGEDWAVQVTVNVPSNTMNPDSRVGMGLFILNQDDHRDQAELTLTRSKYAGVLNQAIWRTLDVDNIEDSRESDPVSTTYATVRFRWDSVEKNLYYEYDADGPADVYTWVTLTSKQLDSGSSNWNMNSGSSFIAAVIGASGNKSVAVGDNVWLDDFTITGYPPTIDDHPVSQTVAKNSNVNFTVAASGTALTYQWQKEEIDIDGATSATLALSTVALSDSGNYRCVVSNTAGSATSNSATLTVINFFKKWEFVTGGIVHSSPAIGADGTVYFGSDDNKTYALNSDGTKKWEFETGDIVYSSPAIGSDGTVYVGSRNNKVYALDGASGAKKWEFGAGADVYSSPAIGSDGTVYVGSEDGNVYALDGSTGAKKWEFVTGNIVSSAPAIGSDGTVYVGSYDNKVYALDGTSGAKKWEFVTGDDVDSSPAIGSDGTVYVGSYDNKVYALDGTSGAKKWEFVTGSIVHSPPAIGVDGTIYFGSDDNKIYALTPDGTQKWEFVTGDRVNSSPTIGSDGTIYIGSNDNKVYALNSNGIKLWEFVTGNGVTSSPAIGADGTLYFGSDDNKLYALQTASMGLANSPWPKFGQNNRNTGLSPWPLITSHPVSLDLVSGSSATFSITAHGEAPLSYQWQKQDTNGSYSNIADTNSTSYTINPIATGDAGTYRCVVSNSHGLVTSNPATLIVGIAPAITTHPVSQNVIVGTNPTFTVVATGTVPLSYQWQKDGANIPDTNSSSYTITSAQSDDNGSYSCIISNKYASDTSNSATLLVGYAPTIASHPASADQVVGSSVTFSITLSTGSTPLSYQWQKDGTNISGANSASYTITSLTTDHNGSYHCNIQNLFGWVTSNAATLTVGYAPAITNQPADQNAIVGTSPTFTVVVIGTTPLSYQWQKDTVDISGATSASYTIANVQLDANGTIYRCYISNKYGNITSSSATLVVGYAPAFATHPASFDQIMGSSVTFSITLSEGTEPVTYQWQLDGVDISGATGTSHTISSISASDAGTYRCVASNDFAIVTSNAATLTVGIPPAITSQPADQNATIGSNPTFIVVSIGTEPVSYQWQKDGIDIPDTNSSSYTIANVSIGYIGNYQCIVSNKYATTTSQSAKLDVGTAPSIILSPVAISALTGSRVTLSAAALGTDPLTYQWQKDNVNVDISNTFTIANYYPQYSSSNYKWYKDTEGNWVYIIPQGLMYQKQILKTTFGRSYEKRRTYNYDKLFWSDPWFLVGRNFYTIDQAQASDSATYRCVIHNRFGSRVTGEAALTVSDAPTITSHPHSQDLIVGTKATFTIIASGTGTLTYQWQKDGVNIDGATEASYSIETTSAGDAGIYHCIVSSDLGSATSNNATLTVGSAPTITAQPASMVVSADGNATFSISATGNGTLSYQWQKDGVNISGGTGFIISQYYPQYDRYDRKWLKDNRGMWFLLFSDGTLKYYLSDEVKGKFDLSTWNNPWKLIGPNHFTIVGVKATDTSKYRCVVSNAGSTTSNEATLTVQP